MIKEIEVGGVKHSITLADDMVGTGLQKDMYGLVSLKLTQKSDSNIISGLTFTGDTLGLSRPVVAEELAGRGLVVHNGQLVVSGDVLTHDTSFIRKVGDMMVTGIVNSGLYSDILNGNQIINLNLNTSSGLHFMDGGFSNLTLAVGIKIPQRTSGLRLFFNEEGELDVTQD